MIIGCFRCGKEIDTPNEKNADYIMAEDTIVKELREQVISRKRLLGLIPGKTKMVPTDIQKTGIICPKCHRPTDVVIWGVHKKV